jgi:hypothetical protein
MAYKKILTLIITAIMLGIFRCTSDPPEPTGTFQVAFSGTINDEVQGDATFKLVPNNTNGLIIINLTQSSSDYFRLSFFNTDPAQIFLDPGTYTVVEQLGQNVTGEVIVDYFNNLGKFSATSGEIRVGVVKESQIKGDLLNVQFNLLNSACNGNFDAIRE